MTENVELLIKTAGDPFNLIDFSLQLYFCENFLSLLLIKPKKRSCV